MARATFYDHALDKEGRPLVGATVYIYDVGTTDLVSETVYAGRTGATTKANPFTTGTDGKIEFFLDNPKIVSLKVTKSGNADQNFDRVVVGLGINHRGAWDSGETYEAQDAVSNDGSSWVALRENTNVTPVEGDDWTVLAEAGDDGAAGANGSDGLISEVQDEGVAVTDAGVMDFVGGGVTTTSDGAKITVTIPADEVTQAELDAHAADTTSVHGIADTSVLATDSEIATAVSDHSADTTSVHGIADTSALLTTVTIRIDKTWAVKGTAVNGELPGFFVSLPAGQTQSIVGAHYQVESGTVTAQVRVDGVALTDLTGLAVSSTAATKDEDPDVALADGDYVDIVLSSASTPVDLRFSLFLDVTV